MKKLMTMLSAVAVAFGLQAASPYPSGSSFNEENWLEIEAETNLWTSLEGLSISTTPATFSAAVGAPDQFHDEDWKNNLEFKRGLTDPTYRAIQLGENGVPVKQPLTNAVVVDTLIKFTPYDVEDPASLDGTNAKLAVWVRELEGEDGAASSYQLMVTAGKWDSEKAALTRTDYACSSKFTDIDAWYRLTVKAIADVSNGYNIPGFVVFVNGELVTSSEVKTDVSNIGNLSNEAMGWNVNGGIFPSLIGADKTIQQVGFAGQGWIDDLSFTDVIPSWAAATETFTIVGDVHVESFVYENRTWKKGDAALLGFSTAQAATEVTNIVYEAGYFGPEKFGVNREANSENVVGPAQALAATVTIGNRAENYAVLTQAIAAINEAAEDVTLRLGANVENYIEINNVSKKAVTLDLAGHTVLNYIYAFSKLIIMDSSTDSTGKVDGEVAGDDDMLAIRGGKFLVEKNLNGIVATLPEGKALVEQDGYYVLGDARAEDGSAANPYTISTEEDLAKLTQYGVGSGNAGKHFVLQNDLTLTSAWAGVGVYDNTANASAFEGVFDGQGHTISGVTFTKTTDANNYRGFFNQIHNATIKNVTVQGDGFGSNVPTGEYGCALLVGCANDSTISNCVTKGSIASATHNAGGIVVRIKDTTIQACTNEANVTGSYTKVGGIVVLNQNSTTACRIEGCVNKGTLTVSGNAEKAGQDGLGGIIAYVGDDRLTIKDCSNEGALVKGEGAHASAKVGQVVGYMYAAGVTVAGTLTVRTDAPTVGDRNNHSVDGLAFATVAENVATLVANSEAAAGASLKVMAEGTPSIALAKGESITLDETLAKATVTAPADCDLSHVGNVYTATEKAPASVTPDGEAIVVDTEEAASNLGISATSPDENIVASADYAKYFTKKVTVTADGKFSVMAVLDTTVVKADEVAAELVGKFGEIAEDGVTVSNAKPGLYYSVKQGQTLGAMGECERVQATASTVKIKATKFTGSGFYEVLINTKPTGNVQ